MPSQQVGVIRKNNFAKTKDSILADYKRALGAFAECLANYELEYGVPFDHKDALIPDVFKHFYQLVGMRKAVMEVDVLDEIHAELCGAEDYCEWDLQ